MRSDELADSVRIGAGAPEELRSTLVSRCRVGSAGDSRVTGGLEAGTLARGLVANWISAAKRHKTAEHCWELLRDSFTADCSRRRTGRPSLSADLAGSVLVLKELHDLPDAQTAEALKFDAQKVGNLDRDGAAQPKIMNR